jgi:hypothetical protein
LNPSSDLRRRDAGAVRLHFFKVIGSRIEAEDEIEDRRSEFAAHGSRDGFSSPRRILKSPMGVLAGRVRGLREHPVQLGESQRKILRLSDECAAIAFLHLDPPEREPAQ